MFNNTHAWVRPGVRAAALLLFAGAIVRAQDPVSAPEPVRDNSFLVEEAFNQPAGVVQHVVLLDAPSQGGMSVTLGEEWPLGGMRHQFSYSIPLQRAAIGGLTGIGDVGAHYRYQLAGLSGGRTYLAPRVSLYLPTGDEVLGMGAGGATIEALLPLTFELSQVSLNGNLGGSITPRARDGAGNVAATSSVTAGGSVMWAVTRSFNLLLETLWSRETIVVGPSQVFPARQLTISPGFRWAQDFGGDVQLVRGAAFTITRGPDGTSHAAVFYLSIEHPFR